ncbi:hypothetical protein Tco_1039271 [Tanacetum coccineum]
MDSENDNEKVNLPSLSSPKPAIGYFDDLDFFKDFENEFPAIVYNNAQTSKSDLLTESILSPQHIDEFDLNDKTSLSEYAEEEQNILYFNDLLPFNIIHPDDLKSEKDNDDNEIDMIQSSRGENGYKKGDPLFVSKLQSNTAYPLTWIRHMALTPRDQRYLYLRYEGLQYADVDIADFEARLARIYRMEVHRVQVFNFGGLPDLMADGLSARMPIEHRDAQGVSLFTTGFGEAMTDLDTPGALQFQLGGARRRLSWRQVIVALGLHTGEDMESSGFARYWAESARQMPDKGDLRDYWIGISFAGDFLGTDISYTAIRDLILRLCYRLIACSIAGRSQAPEKVTVTDLFYLRGMDVGSVNVSYLLARYLRLFAAGRKSGTHSSGGQFDAPVDDEGGQAVPAPVQAPQPPPPPVLMEASGLTYQAFDGTFRGSSPVAFHRRTRQRTGEARTSTA